MLKYLYLLILFLYPLVCDAQGQITRIKPLVPDIPSKQSYKTIGKIDGHEWVDLGLPSGTKWATCNVGADAPEETGLYLSWGETQEKAEYTKDNKLSVEREIFSNYSKTVRNYNIADLLWGKKWDLPRNQEFSELRTECKMDSIKINGSDCYVFTGPNGNKLILPKTGYKDGSVLKNTNEAHYWQADCRFEDNETIANWATSYYFPNEGGYSGYYQHIYLGLCVRPVVNWYYLNK